MFEAFSVSRNEDDWNEMHVWSFNEEDGLWDDEGEMEIYKDVSTESEDSHVFLIARISISSRRLWSLNLLIEEYCYAKGNI